MLDIYNIRFGRKSGHYQNGLSLFDTSPLDRTIGKRMGKQSEP